MPSQADGPTELPCAPSARAGCMWKEPAYIAVTTDFIMEAKVTQITLRNVPENVQAKLKQMSRKRQQSMNALAVSLLQESLGLKPGVRQQRDLSKICGTWSDADVREFTHNTAVFETLDADVWGDA